MVLIVIQLLRFMRVVIDYIETGVKVFYIVAYAF